MAMEEFQQFMNQQTNVPGLGPSAPQTQPLMDAAGPGPQQQEQEAAGPSLDEAGPRLNETDDMDKVFSDLPREWQKKVESGEMSLGEAWQAWQGAGSGAGSQQTQTTPPSTAGTGASVESPGPVPAPGPGPGAALTGNPFARSFAQPGTRGASLRGVQPGSLFRSLPSFQAARDDLGLGGMRFSGSAAGGTGGSLGAGSYAGSYGDAAVAGNPEDMRNAIIRARFGG